MSDERAVVETSAVVDRVEGDRAVMLVGEDETELIVAADDLPAGAGEGSWLRLRLEVAEMEMDSQARAAHEARVVEKRDRLRQRGSRLRPEN